MSEAITGRQQDHLMVLADGQRHRPISGATSLSCYAALVRKGLADVDLLQGTIGFRITDAGRAALSSAAPPVEAKSEVGG